MKSMNEFAIRNAISRIHRKNHGVTMNAAAYVFADRKGFGLYRYLSTADKLSLNYLKTPAPQESKSVRQQARSVTVRSVKTDFETPFLIEANKNAKAYPHIYILENTLRSVILQILGGKQDWWKDEAIVSKDIQDYAARIQQAEKKYPWMKDRGDHPIWYVGLLELFKIIDKNWKPHFSEVFVDLDQLRAWIKESVPIRNYVAHNVKLRDQEVRIIQENTDYICRLVEKWRKKNGP